MEEKRGPVAHQSLDPKVVNIMTQLAGTYADQYIDEFIFNYFKRTLKLESGENFRQQIADRLEDPFTAVQIFYSHYAFSRRGKDRDFLCTGLNWALAEMTKEQSFESILSKSSGETLWQLFESFCESKAKPSHEQQNRGPIQGILELAQEIYQNDPEQSLSTWIVDAALEPGKLESTHLRMVDIRGVGPKSTSTFIRDMIWIFDIEDDVDPADYLFAQPIDRWMREIFKIVVPESDRQGAPDWIVAGKVTKYARRAKVSPVRFNMGTTYFGQKTVGDPSRMVSKIKQLLMTDGSKKSFPQSI